MLNRSMLRSGRKSERGSCASMSGRAHGPQTCSPSLRSASPLFTLHSIIGSVPSRNRIAVTTQQDSLLVHDEGQYQHHEHLAIGDRGPAQTRLVQCSSQSPLLHLSRRLNGPISSGNRITCHLAESYSRQSTTQQRRVSRVPLMSGMSSMTGHRRRSCHCAQGCRSAETRISFSFRLHSQAKSLTTASLAGCSDRCAAHECRLLNTFTCALRSCPSARAASGHSVARKSFVDVWPLIQSQRYGDETTEEQVCHS